MLKLLKIFALPAFKHTATRKNKKTILALNMSDEAKKRALYHKAKLSLGTQLFRHFDLSALFLPRLALSGGRA